MTHIAIIGAGITGITTAYSLLERGYTVTVFDRNRYAGMETSYANGGQLSASNAEVWNKASTILQGLRWMLRRDAPLLVNPLPSWHKYSWMAEFIANIAHYERNTAATVRLALAARERLFSIAGREGIDFDLKRRGILHIYEDKKDFDKSAGVNALLNAAGLERRAVTPSEIRDLEPALKGSYYAGFFTPSDCTGDIHKFTRGLAGACARRGVRMVLDAVVERIVSAPAGFNIQWRPASGGGPRPDLLENVAADAVVVCAGTASRMFGAMLGDRLNVYPVKGYSITVHLDSLESQSAAPDVSLLDDRAKIVTSRLGIDRFRVAGTAEFNGFNRDIRHDRIAPLVGWTRRQFPGVSTNRVVPWSGLRPMMPGMLPRIGRGRKPGVFYNTGHGHLGWTLSASTAELVAASIETGIAA